MSTALKELHHLVEEGRRIVSRECQSTEQLIDNNLRSFSSRLQDMTSTTLQSIDTYTTCVEEDYALANAMLQCIECMEACHQRLIQIFTQLANNASRKSGHANFAFQVIGSNAADFFMMMSSLDQSSSHLLPDGESSEQDQQVNYEVTQKKKKSNTSTSSIVFPNLELARLYKLIALNSSNANTSQSAQQMKRVYTILSYEDFQQVLTYGWSSLSSSNSNKSAQICCSTPNLLPYLFEDSSTVLEFNQPPLPHSNSNTGGISCGKIVVLVR